MQNVRWPFMTNYEVPTVLGTPADVLLQTTVLNSLRGNITQSHEPMMMKSSLEIDARYSSYASCRSRSYNPFLNLEHEINREQGVLLYVPFNISMNYYAGQCLEYSFTRSSNVTSGLSFKSRSVTSTKGFLSKTATEPFQEIVYPEHRHDVVSIFYYLTQLLKYYHVYKCMCVSLSFSLSLFLKFQLFKFKAEDLGLTLIVNTNLNELNKYRGLLLKSEFIEKYGNHSLLFCPLFTFEIIMHSLSLPLSLSEYSGFSHNMFIHFMMYIFGVAQLSTIHLGHDRNLTLLLTNDEPTRVRSLSSLLSNSTRIIESLVFFLFFVDRLLVPFV